MAELIQYANGVPGIKWPLDKAVVRIGRSDNQNDISLDDAFASKAHAQIELAINDDQSAIDYYVHDMQSTNHTYLNQTPVEHTLLSHNDILVIGKSKFVFICEDIKDYVPLDELQNYSPGQVAEDLDESLSLAIEEITEEFKRPDADGLVTTIYAARVDRHKFSRRLNLN